MKVLVPVKRVVDHHAEVRVMNPFDETAVEGAFRPEEKGIVAEHLAVSGGLAQRQATLRTGIVAIDEATEAPIFGIAGRLLQPDLFTAVPEPVTSL